MRLTYVSYILGLIQKKVNFVLKIIKKKAYQIKACINDQNMRYN